MAGTSGAETRSTTKRSRSEPFLQLRPEFGQGTEIWAFADIDGNVAFQSVRIVRSSYVFHVFEFLLQIFFGVVHYDHAIAGVTSRAPEKISLVAAEGRGQSVTRAKEINRPSLSEVLGKDRAVSSLSRRKPQPGLGYGGHDLLPSKLIGVTLGQKGTHVTVLGPRSFQRILLHVGNELVTRQHRDPPRSGPRRSCKQENNDG